MREPGAPRDRKTAGNRHTQDCHAVPEGPIRDVSDIGPTAKFGQTSGVGTIAFAGSVLIIHELVSAGE
jgi:hypothetical protein